MGGGAMWRSVIRVVGSAPTTAASNAAMCRMCTTTPALKAPTSARIACNCPAETHAPGGQANSGLKQYWDIEDWEFAGDDERDHLVFGTLPTQREVEEAASDLEHALRIGHDRGLLTGRNTSPLESPPACSESNAQVKDATTYSTVNGDGEAIGYHVMHPFSDGDWIEPAPLEAASTSSSKDIGGKSAMLEAFHQFQHNPQVQKMVVSLATDKGVWDAVLANDQIKDFRQKLRNATGLIENGSDLTVDEVSKSLKDDANLFSQVYWNTKKAFTQFMTTLQELIRGIFDVTEQKLELSEADDFFEHTVRSTMMLSVLVMSLVVFKRSAAHCS